MGKNPSRRVRRAHKRRRRNPSFPGKKKLVDGLLNIALMDLATHALGHVLGIPISVPVFTPIVAPFLQSQAPPVQQYPKRQRKSSRKKLQEYEYDEYILAQEQRSWMD